MSYLPKNLTFLLNRLSGYAKNTTKLYPDNRATFQAGEIITFHLPSNSLIDLHSLALVCKAQATSSADKARLPRYSSSLVQKLEVYVNGVSVGLQGCSDYGAVYSMLRNLTTGDSKIKEMSVYELGAPQTTQVANVASVAQTVVINDWLGILSGDMFRFLDTSITGPVMVRIHLAQPGVVGIFTGETGAGFEVSDVRILCETITFADNLYHDILQRRLESGSPITYPFKNYFTTQTTTSGTAISLPWQVSSQSIDCLYGTLRPAGYLTASTGDYANVHSSSFYKFHSDGDNSKFQFMVNGRPHPQFPADVDETYVLTRNAIDGSSGNQLYANQCQGNASLFKSGMFVFAQSLQHLGASQDNLLSGLDTRGVVVPLTLEWSGGSAGNVAPFVVTEMSSTLDVYAGRSVVFTA